MVERLMRAADRVRQKMAICFAAIATSRSETSKMNRFSEDPALGVLTTVAVLAGSPILLVSHDADDGGWQFLCGTTNQPSDGRIVHLAAILMVDPTVNEVADLPHGWIAYRHAIGGPWTREAQ